MSASAPAIHREGVADTGQGISLLLAQALLFPDQGIDLGEEGVGVLHDRMDMRDIERVHLGERRPVDGGAADDEAFFSAGSLGHGIGLFEGIDAGHPFDGVSAQVEHDVQPPGERPADGEIRRAAHDEI